MPRREILLLLLLLALAACNGVGTRQKGQGLVTAMDDYVAALRWGRYDRAAQFHLHRDMSSPSIDTSQLDAIRVTGHSTRKKKINEAMDEALVEMELQYYHNEYGTLKKTTVQQTWWYNDEAKGWFLSSDFPRF